MADPRKLESRHRGSGTYVNRGLDAQSEAELPLTAVLAVFGFVKGGA